MSAITSKRFRIAFSFAGEKRDFVAEVAAILAQRFGKDKILYDKYHNAEFSRGDLAFYLPDLYEKEADLVVAVFCPDYENKEWCGLEWNAIFGLLKKRKVSEVMLSRFGRVEGKGLRGLAGYTDLDDLTPGEAADIILNRLALNEGKATDFYAAGDGATKRPVTTIPNNLPRLQPFFGRTEELELIAEALDPKTRTWGALIDGPGGMGKTSLAVRAAYDCTPDQFDRIIFLSVKDRELDDDGQRELGVFILPGFLEMLNELARELGQPDINKAAESERIRLILDALEPTKTLLILDNLESLTKGDRDKLFTFVKRLPQGCKAILTSRRRIGSGSELLILPKLNEEAALETLADLARHNPLLAKTTTVERISLHEQTDGNPLLLRWTAGQLGRGSCRTIADALAFLRSCPPQNDPLEFIFGDLANEFTDDETKVVAALTYFTLPASIGHVSDVAGLDHQTVDPALRTLVNRSLIVPDQEERTFTLVPMVAEFLRRKRPDIISETGHRLEHQAYSLIMENGFQRHDLFPVLDAAWPTLATALSLYLSGPNDRLQAICGALPVFLNFTGRWDEWLSLEQQSEVKAASVNDHRSAGWRAQRVGQIHALRRQGDAVLASADRAAGHWRAGKSGPFERGTAMHLMGLGHMLRNNNVAAISAYREALELFRSLDGQESNIALVLNDIGRAEAESRDWIAADRDFREALGIARAERYEEGVAYIMGNLACLALDRGDLGEAETLARQSLPLAESVGRLELVGLDCHTLAQALLRQARCNEALPYARRAAKIFMSLNSPDAAEAIGTLEETEAEVHGEKEN